MPLSKAQRLEMRRRLHPAADDLVFGSVERALERYIPAGAAVMDAGSGTGTWVLERHSQRVRLLAGVDIEPPTQRSSAAPLIADLAGLPFADGAFDLILCYNVIEHLSDPRRTFAGFARVLAAGGALVFKTPNLTAPVTAASRIVPLSLRRRVKGGLGVSGEHVFATYYRCNTLGALDSALRATGLRQVSLLAVDQTYDYLYFTRGSYALGLLYSRLTAPAALAFLRNTIIGVYVKPSACVKSLDRRTPG